MDASKFSNFSIDYILGENTRPAESPAAPQAFRGDPSDLNPRPPGGFTPPTRGGPVVGLQTACQGIYDVAPYYSPFSCCGPVTYYQTNFNMTYCSNEHWLHTECDREEAHCYQTGQQRQRNRARTVFTESQMTQLDQLFSITEYPSVEARAELARNTGLSEETVRVWFKNRRARRKRQRPSPTEPRQTDQP